MIKVVFWGYGNTGKQLFPLFYDSDEYEIVAVVDSNYAAKKNEFTLGNYEIQSPKIGIEMCENGKADGVVIGAGFPYNKEICEILLLRHIPIISPQYYDTEEIKNICDEKISIHGKFFHYRLSDVYVTDEENLSWTFIKEGRIFKEIYHSENAYKCLKEDWLQVHPTMPLKAQSQHVIEDETFILTMRHSKHYGHFLFQVLPHILLANEWGYNGKFFLKDLPCIREILDLFKIDRKRVIFAKEQGDTYLFKKALLPDIVMPDSMYGDSNAQIGFSLISNYLDNVLKKDPSKYPSRLYLKRKYSRRLLDKSEKLVMSYGFVPMIPEDHTVEEQLTYFHNADIVVCPHGGGSVSAIAMQKGKCFIDTFPYNWVHPNVLEMVDMLSLKYFMVVEHYDWSEEKPTYDDMKDTGRDYEVPLIILKNAIEAAIQLSKTQK